MRPIRELVLVTRTFAVATLLATTACTACTPAGPDEPGGSSRSAEPVQTERTRQELEPPPADQMIRTAPGVDLSKLSETQQSTFYSVINTEPSACEKPHSLATSLRDDPECRNSMLVAQ